MWYIDGYDNSASCTWSDRSVLQKFLWLKSATTNKDLQVVAYEYLEAIKKLEITPLIIRHDRGTENNSVEVRLIHDDKLSDEYFISGKSTANQKMESGKW